MLKKEGAELTFFGLNLVDLEMPFLPLFTTAGSVSLAIALPRANRCLHHRAKRKTILNL